MRYRINFDKILNQLVPYYMGGRRLILYLQALMKPLQQANDEFVDYAKETRIEAAMTTEIFKFEWYLNRKFKQYFADPTGRISIKNSDTLGVPIYRESASIELQNNVLLYHRSEANPKKDFVLYRSDENTDESSVSFTVSVPRCNEAFITEAKYKAMLKYVIDRYRLANKTYIIKYES